MRKAAGLINPPFSVLIEGLSYRQNFLSIIQRHFSILMELCTNFRGVCGKRTEYNVKLELKL